MTPSSAKQAAVARRTQRHADHSDERPRVAFHDGGPIRLPRTLRGRRHPPGRDAAEPAGRAAASARSGTVAKTSRASRTWASRRARTTPSSGSGWLTAGPAASPGTCPTSTSIASSTSATASAGAAWRLARSASLTRHQTRNGTGSFTLLRTRAPATRCSASRPASSSLLGRTGRVVVWAELQRCVLQRRHLAPGGRRRRRCEVAAGVLIRGHDRGVRQPARGTTDERPHRGTGHGPSTRAGPAAVDGAGREPVRFGWSDGAVVRAGRWPRRRRCRRAPRAGTAGRCARRRRAGRRPSAASAGRRRAATPAPARPRAGACRARR